jgi:hypothetical protein
MKNGKDLLTEIITRKDGGSKGKNGFHKAHLSFYSHIRKMKKANTLAIDQSSNGPMINNNNNDDLSINQDLECVIMEQPALKIPRKKIGKNNYNTSI